LVRSGYGLFPVTRPDFQTLPNSNHFSVLPIYDVSPPTHITENDEDAQPKPIGPEPVPNKPRPPRQPKWKVRLRGERGFSEVALVEAEESNRSLKCPMVTAGFARTGSL